VLEDQPDNRILECAVAAGADLVVTGDRHLLRLRTFRGIPIVRLRDLIRSFPDELS
jgi:predicted nucleic acid-binding protein